MPRTIAIGDIHGHLAALDGLLAAIEPAPDDTLITLGDYVDRGPDSRGVVDRLIQLGRRCRLVPLLGNHDLMMLEIRGDGQLDLLDDWLLFGGAATVASYGGDPPGDVPPEHLDFLRGCRLFHETERHLFVHANYDPDRPLAEQSTDELLWPSLRARVPRRHVSGKTAIVGHTAQKTGEVLDLGHLKCIDTYIYGDGCLTALEIDSDRIWQVDARGRVRGAAPG